MTNGIILIVGFVIMKHRKDVNLEMERTLVYVIIANSQVQTSSELGINEVIILKDRRIFDLHIEVNGLHTREYTMS